MKTNNKNGKHLTLQDRYDIEHGLNQSRSFGDIALKLGKDRTTISKEIRKHRISDRNQMPGSNDCMHRRHCRKNAICPECESLKRCAGCRKEDCREFCDDYRSDQCQSTRKAPYVCNGCQDTYDCRKPHYFYRANVANNNYRAVLQDAREGIVLSREQLREIDCLMTPLLRRGQSIAHIHASHEHELPCSLRSLYSYIDMGLFTARNIDLPKKVKYKARRRKRAVEPVDYGYREGRTYKDFLAYIQDHPEVNVVEMDTVHGSNKKGNVMLTMLFRNCNLMLIFLMPECTKKAVKSVFDDLEISLGTATFQKVFQVILTDNGPEFKGADALENSSIKGVRTRVFYCDPLASWQKAKLEKNHVYIRKVLPKGRRIDGLNQSDMTRLANHINSTLRASLNGRTPFELASLLIDRKLIEVAGLIAIPPDQVTLNKSLL